MKKTIFLPVLAVALAAVLTSCTVGAKQSPDLALYGLRGQVKNASTLISDVDAKMQSLSDGGFTTTLSFSKDGLLKEENACTFKAGDLKRDGEGRIVEMAWSGVYGDGVEYGETRSYVYQAGLQPDTIVSQSTGEMSITTTTVPTYDGDGNVLTSHNLQVMDGSEISEQLMYEILESDAQGNWTRRFRTTTTTSRWLKEDGTLGEPEVETTYKLEQRTISYWDAADNADAAAPEAKAEEKPDGDADGFDGCYRKSDLQELVYYVATRQTSAYESPTSAQPMVGGDTYEEGYKVMAESGAASFSEYDKDWYVFDWRGETTYFKRADFERRSVQCTSLISTSLIKPGKELWFKAADGSTITLSILATDGHKFTPLSDSDVYGIHIGENVYIMQFGGEYGGEPFVLSEEKGYVSLCGMGSYISRTEGDVNDCTGVVINGALTCDAWHVCFPDPDFNYEVYYVPSEKALLLNGDLYRFEKEQ